MITCSSTNVRVSAGSAAPVENARFTMGLIGRIPVPQDAYTCTAHSMHRRQLELCGAKAGIQNSTLCQCPKISSQQPHDLTNAPATHTRKTRCASTDSPGCARPRQSKQRYWLACEYSVSWSIEIPGHEGQRVAGCTTFWAPCIFLQNTPGKQSH
jgi:hypothetical protein